MVFFKLFDLAVQIAPFDADGFGGAGHIVVVRIQFVLNKMFFENLFGGFQLVDVK